MAAHRPASTVPVSRTIANHDQPCTQNRYKRGCPDRSHVSLFGHSERLSLTTGGISAASTPRSSRSSAVISAAEALRFPWETAPPQGGGRCGPGRNCRKRFASPRRHGTGATDAVQCAGNCRSGAVELPLRKRTRRIAPASTPSQTPWRLPHGDDAPGLSRRVLQKATRRARPCAEPVSRYARPTRRFKCPVRKSRPLRRPPVMSALTGAARTAAGSGARNASAAITPGFVPHPRVMSLFALACNPGT